MMSKKRLTIVPCPLERAARRLHDVRLQLAELPQDPLARAVDDVARAVGLLVAVEIDRRERGIEERALELA
jgi:hypothetical protein